MKFSEIALLVLVAIVTVGAHGSGERRSPGQKQPPQVVVVKTGQNKRPSGDFQAQNKPQPVKVVIKQQQPEKQRPGNGPKPAVVVVKN